MRFATKKKLLAILAFINNSLTVIFGYLWFFLSLVYEQIGQNLMGEHSVVITDETTLRPVTILVACFIVLDLVLTLLWMKGKKGSRWLLAGITCVHLIAAVLYLITFFSYSFNQSLNGFTGLVVYAFAWTLALDILLFWVMKKEKKSHPGIAA